MASVSGGSLQTLDGISQLPGTVRSDYKHIEDDVTCSSSAMPISDGEGIQKSGQSIEVLRENLGSTMGCRPMTSRRKKDSLLLIEKPIFSRHQSNGTPHSPRLLLNHMVKIRSILRYLSRAQLKILLFIPYIFSRRILTK